MPPISRETVIHDVISTTGTSARMQAQDQLFITGEADRIRAAGGVVLQRTDSSLSFAISVGGAIRLGYPAEAIAPCLVQGGHAATPDDALAAVAPLLEAGPDTLPTVTDARTIEVIGERIVRWITLHVARVLGSKATAEQTAKVRVTNLALAFRALRELGILTEEGMAMLVRRHIPPAPARARR